MDGYSDMRDAYTGKKTEEMLGNLLERYPALEECKTQIARAYETMAACFSSGRKLLIAGNGGSCSDAQHMVGELMKGLARQRHLPQAEKRKLQQIGGARGEILAQQLQRAFPAMALDGHTSLNTAFANDVNGTFVYAQQVYGYGRAGDAFLAITTSGNSENILCAAVAAKARGMQVIGLTGKDGGELKELADLMVMVPEKECMFAQELHLPIYHCWCMMLEDYFFGE